MILYVGGVLNPVTVSRVQSLFPSLPFASSFLRSFQLRCSNTSSFCSFFLSKHYNIQFCTQTKMEQITALSLNMPTAQCQIGRHWTYLEWILPRVTHLIQV